MKLIKPSYEFWEQKEGLSGVEAQIERAARVCYASEPKGEVGELLGKLIKSKHYAMLEHGTVYLMIDCSGRLIDVANKYIQNKYSKVSLHSDRVHYCITTNYRVLVENNWLDDLKYLCEPTEYHEKRITVKFTMDRIGSQSFCRHRVFSFAQESTRYCNYSKDKFDNEITFIIPSWVDTSKFYKHSIIIKGSEGELISEYYYHLTGKEEPHFKPWEITPESNFKVSLEVSEQLYLALINQGWKPEQARQVLPNALKTELVMTGFVSDWKHFFDLRAIGTTGKPHPDTEILAKPLMNEFIERSYLNGTSNS